MRRVVAVLAFLILTVQLTAKPAPIPKNWASLDGPPGGNVNAFALASNGDLWAGTQSGGVYRLPSGTTTWQAVNSGLFHVDYGKVFINVFDLAFASNGDLYAATNEGEVFRLANGSSTWTALPESGLPGTANVLSVRIVGTDVFVGTNGAGVYKFASGGSTWSAVSTGLPSTTSATVTSLAVTAANVLVAGTQSGVHLLSSGSSTWTSSGTGLTTYITDVIVDGATGRIWASAFDSGVFFLNSGSGVWSAAPGMQNPYVMSLVLDSNGDLYAGLQAGGCCGGVDRLPSGSGSWIGSSNLQGGLDIYRQVRAIAIASSKVHAGTSRGVYRLDSGPSWTAVHTGMSAFRIEAIYKRSNGQLLVGTEGGGIFAYSSGVWSEFNTGITVSTLPAQITNILETPDGHLFASLRGSGVGRYVLRMTSGSGTWAEYDTGITGAVSNADVLGLDYNATEGYVYVSISGTGGVFRSTPTGATWSNASNGLTDLSVASILAASNGDMYAGTVSDGVFRKPVNLTTWSAFNSGAASPFNVLALGQNRKNGDLWATYADQQYRYPSAGSEWIADSEGFYGPSCPSADVHTFTSTEGGVMWAGSFCGAARRKYDSAAWRYENDNLFPANQGTNTSFAFVTKLHAVGGGVYAGVQGLAVKYRPHHRILWRNTVTLDINSWIMEGGSFVSGAVLLPAGADWVVERWTDLDGDGRMEVIVRNASASETHVWEFDENGKIASGFVLPKAGPEWSIIAADDFNGDGKTDLVWRHGPSMQVHMWLMDGATITAGAVLPAGAEWSIAATGDLNGDGKADLVWRYAEISQTHIWFMDGTTFLSGAVLPHVGPEWTLDRFGDFDGDRNTDFIWRNTSGATHMWMMNGATIKAGAVLPVESTEWQIAAAGDFDGDGRSDLVWRNMTTYDAHMWIMNGGSIAAGAVLPPAGSSWLLVP